ncbi:MAG TPA: O-antigen ligase family protein [Acidothermaceae bacterium]|nr:O-antigen ligase family protein [Acidothermaceae bacterium]
MTAVAAPPLASPTTTAPAAVSKDVVPGVIIGLAAAYLTMPFAQATGGRDSWALTKAAVVVLVALLAAKPWQRLRVGTLALAVAVALAALTVCLVTPPGWFGATRASSYGVGAGAFIAVASYARSVRRAYLIGAIVAAAGAVQFCWSFVAWWGGRDQSIPMVGTFYWHNQYAAFLLAPALIALTLLVNHRPPWRLVGWVVAPLAVAGVVYSSSRGGLGILIGGWLLIGVLAFRVKPNRGALVRWLAASVLAAGVTLAISGPPFFASSSSPFASTEARASAGGTADASSSYRVQMWHEAVIVFDHHPVAGVGYGALESTAAKLTPANWPRSPLAHNDYLQALAEGGLLLGVPFLAACAAIGVGLLRGLRSRARRRVLDVRTGLIVGAGALMAHAAIDFDWTYPALFTLAAIVSAAAIAPALRRPDHPTPRADVRHPARPRVRVALVAVLAIAIGAGGIAGHRGGLQLGIKSPGTIATTGAGIG